MSTFVLIHGAGDVGWYWHLVEAELRSRGHDVVAPDLPCDDDRAGLPEYADAVIAAIGERTDLVVVGQSLGGFVAPLVCARVPVDRLILVAPMIPAPGEAVTDYWAATGWDREVRGDHDDWFYQDVPRARAARAREHGRAQSEARLSEPSPLTAWPDVPTRVLICRDDRMFPPAFLRRVARERLGIEPDEIDGGHTPALSRPVELAGRLDAYAAIPVLIGIFFAAFTSGDDLDERLDALRGIFLPGAIIIRTCGSEPQRYDVDGFIAPRRALLSGDELTGFREWEVTGRTEVYGDVAQHFCTYAKSWTRNGAEHTGRGAKTMQFARTAAGWRLSAVAWDDER
jgi:pimeloyl-ACP methyl ester carboxylesterase